MSIATSIIRASMISRRLRFSSDGKAMTASTSGLFYFSMREWCLVTKAGMRTAHPTPDVVRWADTGQKASRNFVAPEKPGSSGTHWDADRSMPTVASLWKVNAAVARALHAWFDFPPNKNSGSALLAPEFGSQFLQQWWRIRVPGEMNNLARTAKTLLHEMYLKVAELMLNDAGKYPEAGL
jgi:hypothetical protein